MFDEISKRLKIAREQSGLSPAQAAIKMDVARMTIVDWEQDCTHLTIPQLLRLCSIYMVQPSWVIEGRNPHFTAERRQELMDKARASGVDFDEAASIVDLLESLQQEGE